MVTGAWILPSTVAAMFADFWKFYWIQERHKTLAGGFNPFDKYPLVSWDDDSLNHQAVTRKNRETYGSL